LVLSWGSCYGWRWYGVGVLAAGGWLRACWGAAPGRWSFRGAVAGARHPGLLALRSASGLGLPAV